MTDIFIKQIVNSYDFDDTSYGVRTIGAIQNYFANMPVSKSKIDPARLGSKAVMISKLRAALIDKSGGIEIEGQPEFNKMTTKQQLAFQLSSIANGTNRWIHKDEIAPASIADICMDPTEATALKAMRGIVDVGKLRDPVTIIDVGKLMNDLLPVLLTPETAKWNALCSALLLATGRRSVEILKTGTFMLGEDDKPDGFFAIFGGQAKTKGAERESYRIPLLAPYDIVMKGLIHLRNTENTKTMTPEEVNNVYAKGLSNYCHTLSITTPHMLRAIYAATTYKAQGDKKMTQLGWISMVLGHAEISNSAYYTRVDVENYNGPYNPERKKDELIDDTDSLWVVSCKADKKAVAAIKALMFRHQRITASSIRTYAGGSMLVHARVIANNKVLIDEYHDEIAK